MRSKTLQKQPKGLLHAAWKALLKLLHASLVLVFLGFLSTFFLAVADQVTGFSEHSVIVQAFGGQGKLFLKKAIRFSDSIAESSGDFLLGAFEWKTYYFKAGPESICEADESSFAETVRQDVNLGLSPGDFETYKAFVDKACFEYVGGIAELFKSEPPENIKVSFTSSPEEHAGRENSGAVELNLKSLRFPHEAINVMVHEAAHVIQGYPAGAPNWAVEGIADYAVLRLRPSLLDTVLIRNCTPRFDYTETDYGCIAFFLLEASENSTCGNDLVVKMNERLRAGGGDADLDAGFRECGFESVQAAWKQHGPL